MKFIFILPPYENTISDTKYIDIGVRVWAAVCFKQYNVLYPSFSLKWFYFIYLPSLTKHNQYTLKQIKAISRNEARCKLSK